MLIVAIGPESHDLVVHRGNGRVLDNNAELLQDSVSGRRAGNCACYRAGHGSKQSKDEAR